MADYNKVMHKLDYLDDTKVLIKDAIIEKGQDITDDVTFREYVDKIKEISSGDVKLFNTVDEMNEYPKAKDGDLGIVYNRDFTDIYRGVSFSAVCIPRVIVLGTVPSVNSSLYASSREGCNMFSYISEFDSENIANSYIAISLNNTKQTIDLRYVPDETGLIYTFSSGYVDGRTELVFDTETFIFDFESSLNFDTFNDIFISVFKIRVVDLQGLYQYTINNEDITKACVYNKFNFNTTLGIYEGSICGYVNIQEIYNILKSSKDSLNGLFIVSDLDSTIPNTLIHLGSYNSILHYDNKMYVYANRFSSLEDAQNYIADAHQVVTTYNLTDGTYTETTSEYSILEVNGTESTIYYVIGTEILDTDMLLSFRYNDTDYALGTIEFIVPNESTADGMFYSFSTKYGYSDKWKLAPTQFTATDNSYIVTNKSAYGKNGVIVGDGSYLKHTTTKEYRNYFANQLSETKQKLYTDVVQSGESVPYYTYCKRVEKDYNDTTDVPTKNSLVVNNKIITQGSITNETYNKAYSCQNHRTFYVDKDDRLYYGYFGYNTTDRESPGKPGSHINETITEVHGVLIDLVSKEVIREVNNTTSWTPFDGWGNDNENPNASISYLNYDVLHDEFIMIVTTGTWAWSNSTAPFLGIMKINGTTGAVNLSRYQLGKNGVSRTYAQVYDVRYDITTKNLIIPINSFEANGANSLLDRIIKLDSSGNKSIWVVMEGIQLGGLDKMGDEESFYTKAPIYYYKYTDSSNKTHHILKRIDNDLSLEIPEPYSMDKHRRIIYNNYFYYMSLKTSGSGYSMIRVNLTSMTYEEYGTFKSYNSEFVLFNNVPMVYYLNTLYSLNDLDEPVYKYKMNYSMFNDVRVDGLMEVDGYIEGMYVKADPITSGISFKKVKQTQYEYSKVETFPVDGDLMLTWPTIDDYHTMGNLYMYDSLWLSTKQYDGTISPFDYQQALKTARKIEGKNY